MSTRAKKDEEGFYYQWNNQTKFYFNETDLKSLKEAKSKADAEGIFMIQVLMFQTKKDPSILFHTPKQGEVVEKTFNPQFGTNTQF